MAAGDRTVIHVFSEAADYLADRIKAAQPDRTVIALKTPGALRAALGDIEVLFAGMPPREGWAGADRLRLIQLLGTGVDTLLPSMDLPAHVEIAGVRGLFAPDVAEHALALMLAHARQLGALAGAQHAHKFEATPRSSVVGQLVVIVGNGEVGRRLARAALALEMRVRVVSRSGRGASMAGVELLSADALATAVADARYVVLAVPLTPATTKLFDATMLGRMRPDAYLINVARGGIVDEAALAEALTAGRLDGAALDVFAQEPLPAEDPLWNVPRLTVTPHVAGLGTDYIERCIEVLVTNVAALESDQPRTGLVNRDVGY